MPKRGRRPWVRRQRAKWRAEASRARTAAALFPEAIVAIEVGLDSFHRFRTSSEWQVLGWWGRWLNTWRRIGRDARWRASPMGAMADIYKQQYEGVLEQMSARLGSGLFRVIPDPDVPPGQAFVVPGFGLLVPPIKA